MLEGIQATQGDGQVKMTLSYEDESGTVSTTEQTFNLTVTEATDDAGVDEMPEENAAGGLPIVHCRHCGSSSDQKEKEISEISRGRGGFAG